MAKQKKSIGFDKISNMFENLSKKSVIQIDKGREKSYIGTGIYILNALLSKSILNGGVQQDRITIFAGPPQTGKSFICYGLVRNAQQAGYNVIYIDTEQSIGLTDFSPFGIDISPERFMLARGNKVEDLKILLAGLLDDLKKEKMAGAEIAKTMIILDSVGQLASDKEVNDAQEGKHKVDMSRAKAIKSLFRIINADLGYLEIPLICTNHTYKCFSGEQKVIKSNGYFEQIKNIKVGDFVQTLDGDKPVEEVVEFEHSTVMEIVLDDGETMKCTKNHKFLINEDWNEDEENDCWISAEDLKPKDTIYAVSA